MLVFKEQIFAMTGFVEKRIDLSESHGFIVLGFFPYHCKAIRGNVRVPRHLFKEFEHILRQNYINDNKIVVVCKDTTNFGTDNFAINLKDLYATIGTWDEIKDY